MIFDNFGNMTNDDGSAINQPLDGAYSDANSTNSYGSGGSIRGNTYIQGKIMMVDTSGNVVVILDPNG